jgi:hypothetical protein
MNLARGFLGTLALGAMLAAEPAQTYHFRNFAVCEGCSTRTGGINDERLVGAIRTSADFPVQAYVYDANGI